MSACGLLPLVPRASCGLVDSSGEIELAECCLSAVCSEPPQNSCNASGDCCRNSKQYKCTETCRSLQLCGQPKDCAECSKQTELCKHRAEPSEQTKHSEDCAEYCKPIEDSQDYIESSEQFEDSEDYAKPSEQIEDSEDYAEPSEHIVDSEDYVNPFEQIVNSENYAEPSKKIEDSEDYTEPSEKIGEPEDYAEHSKQIQDSEDYAEPSKPIEDPEDYAEPFEQFGDPEDYAEPSEQYEDPEDYAEPSEQYEDPEDYAEPSEQYEDPEDYAEPSEQYEDPEDYAEPSEQYEDPEDYTEPSEQSEDSEDYAEPSKQIVNSEDYAEPSEQYEDLEDYAEPSKEIEASEDYAELFEQIEDPEDYAEPSEQYEDPEDYTEPSKEIEASEGYAELFEQIEDPEDYAEPSEQSEDSEDYAEPSKQIVNSEDYAEPSEQSEDPEDYVEPSEQSEDSEDYAEPSEQIVDPEDYAEPSEQIEDPEDCIPSEQFEDPEDYAEAYEQIEDLKNYAACSEKIELAEDSAELCEQNEISKDCAEHCDSFEDDTVCQLREPSREYTEHCEWYRGVGVLEENKLFNGYDKDIEKWKLCDRDRSSEQSNFSHCCIEHCETSEYLAFLEPDGSPEMCQTSKKNCATECCANPQSSKNLELCQMSDLSMNYKKSSEPCETFEQSDPNECCLKDCKVCTYFGRSLQNLSSKYCTKNVKVIARMAEPEHCDSSKHYNENNKLPNHSKTFFEDKDCTSWQTEHYGTCEFLKLSGQHFTRKQCPENCKTSERNGSIKSHSCGEKKPNESCRHFGISKHIFAEHSENSEYVSRYNKSSEKYPKPYGATEKSESSIPCKTSKHLQHAEKPNSCKHDKQAQACENEDTGFERSSGQSKSCATPEYIKFPEQHQFPEHHLSDNCPLLERKEPSEHILQHRNNDEKQYFLEKNNLSGKSDFMEHDHTCKQSGSAGQNDHAGEEDVVEQTAEQSHVSELNSESTVNEQPCNYIIEVFAMDCGTWEQDNSLELSAELHELYIEPEEPSDSGDNLAESSNTSEQHCPAAPTKHAELPGCSLLSKQNGPSEPCCEDGEHSEDRNSSRLHKSTGDNGHFEECAEDCEHFESTETSNQGELVELHTEHCEAPEHSMTPLFHVRQGQLLDCSKPLGDNDSCPKADIAVLHVRSSPYEEHAEYRESSRHYDIPGKDKVESCSASKQRNPSEQSVTCCQLHEPPPYGTYAEQSESHGDLAAGHNGSVFGEKRDQRDTPVDSDGPHRPGEPSAGTNHEHRSECHRPSEECGFSEQSKAHGHRAEHCEPSEKSETLESREQHGEFHEQGSRPKHCAERSESSENYEPNKRAKLPEHHAERRMPFQDCESYERVANSERDGERETALQLCADERERPEQSKLELHTGDGESREHSKSSEQIKPLEHCAERRDICQQSKSLELCAEECEPSEHSATSLLSESREIYPKTDVTSKCSQPSEQFKSREMHTGDDKRECSEIPEAAKLLEHRPEDSEPSEQSEASSRTELLEFCAEDPEPSEQMRLQMCAEDREPPEQSGSLNLVYQSRDPEDDELIYENDDPDTCDCDFCVVPLEQVPAKPLLHQVKSEDAGKICVVLDLDETLVHSSFKPLNNADFIIPVEIDGTIHQVYVLKRPHVDEFLKRMGEMFECVLFTASLAKYADPVSDELDKWGAFRSRLFRESCVLHRGNYVKDLSRLGRDLNKVIIVDNSPASYVFHPGNAVPVVSWFNDMSDTQLLDLIPFFERLSKAEDVYAILQDQTL